MSEARVPPTAFAEVLVPLGLRQRGHKGVFIADHRFWLAIVQVDPDRRLLTVGAHFLWYEQSRWCFDAGERLAFDAARPREMAASAAEAAMALEARFGSIALIARRLAEPSGELWPLYHAAVAAGLAGEDEPARHFFARIQATPARRGWEKDVQAAAQRLATSLSDGSFRAAVAAIVARTRALQGLPAVAVQFEGGARAI